MKKFRYYIVFFLLLAGMLIASFILKNNMKPASFESVRNNVEVFIADNPYDAINTDAKWYYTQLYHNKKIDTLKELEEMADAVAVVSLEESQQNGSVVKSNLKVHDVWKADIEIGSNINVFEQYFIDQDNRITLQGCYIPMKKEMKYLAFLTKYDEFSEETYGFTSLIYGKFPIQNELQGIEIEYTVHNEKASYIFPVSVLDFDLVKYSLETEKNYFLEQNDVEELQIISDYEDACLTYDNIMKEIYNRMDIELNIIEDNLT